MRNLAILIVLGLLTPLCDGGETAEVAAGPAASAVYGRVTAEATAGHASVSMGGGSSYGSAYAAVGFGSAGRSWLPRRGIRVDRRATRATKRWGRRAARMAYGSAGGYGSNG